MSLVKVTDFILNDAGRPVPGASVAVLTQPATTTAQPGTPLASIFLDSAGQNAAPNPVTADGLGNYSFYIAPGTYTLQIYGTGIPGQTVLVDYPVAQPLSPSNAPTGQFANGLDANGNLLYATPTNSTVSIPINAQTGTTYIVLNSDQGKLITFNNASAVGVTQPPAGNGGQFISGWFAYFENLGAGTVTITPTTGTIDGASNFTLATNTGVTLVSDGSNYKTYRGQGGSGGSTSVTANTVTLNVANPDVVLSRSAAGTFQIGNGGTGSSGTAQASQFVATPDSGTTSLGRIDSLGLGIGELGVMRFSSTAGSGGTADTGFSRWNAGGVACGNGSQGDFSGRLYQNIGNSNTTAVTVTGTTAQTALQSITVLPAELNAVGRWIRFVARGFNSSGTTGGTITYTLKVGSTTLITFGAFTLTNSLPNSAWYFEVDIMVHTAGATGALEVQGQGTLQNIAGTVSFNTAVISGIDLTGSPSFTLFSTASQTTTSTTSRLCGYQRNN